MIWVARLRGIAGWVRNSLMVVAGFGAVLALLACGSLPAEAETGAPAGTGAASCPSSNPPNTLTLVAGTPQSATLGSAFAIPLQVVLANSDGCPVTGVAGVPVTFSAPSAGAGGLFAQSGSSVVVGSDASGMASATFTANDALGSYTVTASSAYGSVSFSLTNADASKSGGCAGGAAPTDLAGEPTKLTAGLGATQSARVGTRFEIGFAVTVTDAEKNPVAGVLVTFAAPTRGASGSFTARRRRVEVRTDACGVALAPPFTANRRRGGYIVVARVEHVRTAFALVNEAT
jgi:hypothetical protein